MRTARGGALRQGLHAEHDALLEIVVLVRRDALDLGLRQRIGPHRVTRPACSSAASHAAAALRPTAYSQTSR